MRKAGWQTASKIPSKVLTATMPAKFLQAAWKVKTAPQRMILVPRYFAIGSRWMSQLVGLMRMLALLPGQLYCRYLYSLLNSKYGDVNARRKP